MKLMGKDAYDVHKTLSNYQFSSIGLDGLDGSEYTIVQLLVDASSSVAGYKKNLEKAIVEVMNSCSHSPRSENLLMRVATFASHFQDNINEVHGFTPLSSLDPAQYKGSVRPGGATPLFDAALSALESLDKFGSAMADRDYLVNGILFVITDGEENASRCKNAGDIKNTITKIRKEEKLESLQTILIGIDDAHVSAELKRFKDQVGFDQYLSLGDADQAKLAKLARFVSQSIAVVSQSLGSGTQGKIGFVA